MQDDLRPEYDLNELLEGGVRGKYVERYRAAFGLDMVHRLARRTYEPGVRKFRSWDDLLRARESEEAGRTRARPVTG